MVYVHRLLFFAADQYRYSRRLCLLLRCGLLRGIGSQPALLEADSLKFVILSQANSSCALSLDPRMATPILTAFQIPTPRQFPFALRQVLPGLATCRRFPPENVTCGHGGALAMFLRASARDYTASISKSDNWGSLSVKGKKGGYFERAPVPASSTARPADAEEQRLPRRYISYDSADRQSRLGAAPQNTTAVP